ncbi:MAG: 4Fe-4S binding protein [Spirochaetota bacterium]|nr:4Fe-4S binding protein [Spirochaetota bacterium]
MKDGRWSTLRIYIQLIFWLLFISIIVATRFPVENTEFFTIIPRLSPYLGISLSLSVKSILLFFYPSLIILFFTLILGRFFCGWICPLGSTIDLSDKYIPYKRAGLKDKYEKVKYSLSSYKYLILFISLIFSVFGISILNLIDPLSIAVRSFSTAIYSYSDTTIKMVFDGLYRIPILNNISEYFYSLLKDYFLDFNHIQFLNHLSISLMFFGVLLLSYWNRRFWCKAVCPMGAILALTSRFTFLSRIVDKESCTNCLECEKTCRMNAIYNKGVSTIESECIRCFECLKSCRYNAINFGFISPFHRNIQELPDTSDNYDNIRFSRRKLIGSLAVSFFAIPLLKHKPAFMKDHSRLIRPPGALPEENFIDRCIRCGECMKVCPTNGLHPLLMEYGLESIFTPVLIPRIGWCEKNCNLCSKVCPSGALKAISIPDKETTIIGTAYIIKDLCIPWSQYLNCLVCEEMCPTNKKSIIFKKEKRINNDGRSVQVMLPFVLEDTCIGCGICENKCPISGDAAIKIRAPMQTTKDIINI